MMIHRIATGLTLMLAVLISGCARWSATPYFDEEPIVRALVLEEAESIAVILQDNADVFAADHLSRVRLEGDKTAVAVRDGETIIVRDGDSGRELARGSVITFQPVSAEGTFSLRNEATGNTPSQNPNYEGTLELRPTEHGAINAIVVLPVEEYLRGVVPYEIGVTAPFEAMKAQAVAARSETITALTEQIYAGPHYDICSDVHCQVFRGINRRTDQTDAAIRETRGIILTYDGRSIPAYYSSNAGGYTENIVNVWPERDRGIPVWDGVFDGDPAHDPGDLTVEENAREWLLSRPRAYTNADHHPDIPSYTHGNFRWEVTHTAEALTEAVARTRDIGRVLRIETGERGPSARLIRVRFIGENGELEVEPELAIRRTFSPALRSSAFVVETVGDPARPDAFVIRGAGHGHGVGMCQTGAMARAIEGQGYGEILLHYYVGTELVSIYE